MTKHHDLLTADPTDLYDNLTRPFIPARLHLDAARRHIMARPSLVETADKLDATQQLVDELQERLAAVTAENERLRVALAEAKELLSFYTDDEPCRFDHHGYCQTHLATLDDGRCLNTAVAEWLAVMEDGQS